MWMGACVTGFATNRRQAVSGMQPQSAENHKYVCMYVCLHHGKYASVLNPVGCKELGFINWVIQYTSTSAAFCQTKVEECTHFRCIPDFSSKLSNRSPRCIILSMLPLITSITSFTCPWTLPIRTNTARHTTESEQWKNYKDKRIYHAKSSHTYARMCQMCHYKYRMFVDTQPHYTHAHRYSQSTSSLGYCWTAMTGRLSVWGIAGMSSVWWLLWTTTCKDSAATGRNDL